MSVGSAWKARSAGAVRAESKCACCASWSRQAEQALRACIEVQPRLS